MTERLTLPEPARRILSRTHRILDEHLTPHTPGEAGGASAGERYWQHGGSTG